MFSNESMILLTVKLIDLNFFNKEHLATVKEIKDTLAEKNVKPSDYLFYPWNVLTCSLSWLNFCFYVTLITFIIGLFVEGGLQSAINFTELFLSDFSTIPIILFLFSIASFILIKIIDIRVKKRVAKLKETNFNTKEYIEKLRNVLDPYESLGLVKLLKENQNNLFGLVLLQFILVCIEIDYIKHSNIYLNPFELLKKSSGL